MIAELNRAVEAVEKHLADDLDVAALARSLATTEHHLRRMFAALAGMPLSEYVRRRRMSIAAGDVIAGHTDLLTIAVRYGYGSTEAFARAFKSVHGTGPSQVRRDGGPLRTQQQLRFHLSIEGSTTMDTRIIDKPSFRLAGHARRVPLIHEGTNPHITDLVQSLNTDQLLEMESLSDQEPADIVAVTDDIEPDSTEGSELTYLHGVATTRAPAELPAGLDVIEVGAATWAVFTSSGAHPQALQSMWAQAYSQWFPSNPYRSIAGPSLVATLELAADWSTATCELWVRVEPVETRT